MSGTNESIPQEWAFTMFEAMQKAAEIILRARTKDLKAGPERAYTATLPPRGHQSGSSNHGNVSSSSSRRFRLNLEVEEVSTVRRGLAAWKEYLHTPLVLDLIFQGPPSPPLAGETEQVAETTGEGGSQDLLERWYIVFEPLTSSVSSPFRGSGGRQV